MGRLARVKDWTELARSARYQVKALAKICDISTRQLERFFLQTVGLKPHDWLRRVRQLQAAPLLHKLGSVKEAAHELGYKQPAHFSNEFRSFYGVWPSEVLSGRNVAFPHAMSLFRMPLDFSVVPAGAEIRAMKKLVKVHVPLACRAKRPSQIKDGTL